MEQETYTAGSRFDDFLAEEGLLSEAEANAMQHVIAFQIEKAMQEQQISKIEMAQRMGTNNTTVESLLDPNSTSVTLLMLAKAAVILGMQLNIMLEKKNISSVF